MTQMRLLFVCTDNALRSPLAADAMRKVVAEEGRMDEFLIASRGIMAMPGQRGIDGRRPVQVVPADWQGADLILALDHGSLLGLQSIVPGHRRSRVHRLIDFSPWLGSVDVPDLPESDEAVADLTELLTLACRGLLDVIDQSLAGLRAGTPNREPARLKASSVR